MASSTEALWKVCVLHKYYHNDFFLLRMEISVNGMVMEVTESDTPEQVPILHCPNHEILIELRMLIPVVEPDLIKLGVYRINSFFYDKNPLLSVAFASYDNLQTFLKNQLDGVLHAALNAALIEPIKDAVNLTRIKADVASSLFFVSPTSKEIKVKPVTLSTLHDLACKWLEGKMFSFTEDMFALKSIKDVSDEEVLTKESDSGGKVEDQPACETIELYDLQEELGSVVEWFVLGTALRVPYEDLQMLYRDYPYSTRERLLHMLVLWKNLEEPTWEKLVQALKQANMPQLAAKIASKHGIPLGLSDSKEENTREDSSDSTNFVVVHYQNLMKEKDAENEMVQSLNSYMESKIPKTKVKLIELQYAKQIIKDKDELCNQLKERLKERTKLHKERRTKLQKKISKTKEERDEVTRKLERKELELLAAEREITELKLQMEMSGSEFKETRLDDLERKVQLKKKEREKFRTDLCQVESALDQVKEKLLKTDESNIMEQTVLEREINAKEKEVDQLEHNLKSTETDLKEQVLMLQSELADRMEKLTKKSMEIRKVQSEIDEHDVLAERKRKEEEYTMLSKFGRVETTLVDEREQIRCLKEKMTKLAQESEQLKTRLKQEEATLQLLQEELNLQDTTNNIRLMDKISKADQLLTLMKSIFQLKRDLLDATAEKSHMENTIEVLRNSMDESILRSVCIQQLPVTLSELFLGEDLMIKTNSPRALERYPTAYCIRLHGCIPAATSVMVTDHQIKQQSQLTELIPNVPTYPPDLRSFFGILVLHIYKILSEKETADSQYSKWLHNLSTEQKNLRKIVAIKIDEAIIPIFSKIIAYIDQYHNLNLIDPKSPSQFWLAMFDSQVLNLHSDDLDLIRGNSNHGAVTTENSHLKYQYECRMPFFWIIKEAIDCQWNKHDGGDMRNAFDQVCVSLSSTPLGEVLKTIDDPKCEQYYSVYLHDFLKSITSGNGNPQVLTTVISDTICVMDVYMEQKHVVKLLVKVVALHWAYRLIKAPVLWFKHVQAGLPSASSHTTMLDGRVSREMVIYNFVLKQLESDLYYRVWEIVSSTVSANNSVSHKITVLDVLYPCFNECCRILRDLEQWSMRFGEIDQLFHQDDDPEKIKLNLLSLYQGIELCKSETPSSQLPKWIGKAVTFIQNLHHLGDMCHPLLKASETVLSLYNRFKIGEVSTNEVKIAAENIDQLKLLFDCSIDDGDSKTIISPTGLESAVKDREEECRHFRKFQTLLLNLCNHIIGYDQVKGLSTLQHDLERDYGEVNVNKFCRRDPKSKELNFFCRRDPDLTMQPQLVCFKSAGTLSNFAEGFFVLSQRYGSELFSTAWKEAMSVAIKDNPDLTLDNVYPLVWQPCLDRCKQLLLSLSNLIMKLVDVDKVFKDHKDNIDTQLLALFKGVSDCTREQFDWRLIERAIGRIRQYWELYRCRKGANIFLRIRDSLGLRAGDFSLIEELSKELAMSEGNWTLNDVDESLWHVVFLEDIANDQWKADCLETFARCKDIVKWLKKETKDVNEIQHFVNMALATAAGGEGDLSHDKLSDLRTVGSGFASLIYNFPNDAGFIELKKACIDVWYALEKNSNLPHLLDNCNKDIEWYRSVKETQGSVEVTSYGQMRNILKYGHYQVGTTIQSKPVHTIHDLISLKLHVKVKNLSKTSYNLDDLRDLESKLVLITGSKAENRTEVDHYLNILQRVTRIAEVLLALRRAGNVAYSERVVMINCATYVAGESGLVQLQEEIAKQHVAELNTLAKEMENDLEEWENDVKKSRTRYHELNYYTTRQLLRLRKELGVSRHNPHRQIDPEVLALLWSISQDVTSESVYSVKPQLTEQELTDVQKQILSDLVEYGGYSRLLVLTALEKCGKMANAYDIREWCAEYEDVLHFDEDETEAGDIPDSWDASSSESDIEGRDLSVYFLDKALDYLARKDTENEEDILSEFEPVLDDGEAQNEGENIVFFDDLELEKKYLTLNELGAVLKRLSKQLTGWVNKKRTFLDGLKTGSTNLIVTHPSDVLRTVLTLYMEDKHLPLPTLEEVLICSSTTTVEEVNLLWQRAIQDPGFKRIFCLVHAERLSHQTSVKVTEALKEYTEGRQDYRLAIVCSEKGEKSQIVSKLYQCRRSVTLKHSDREYQDYLKAHFIGNRTFTQSASVVDYEKSHVRVVSSNHAGMGKSLFIQKQAEQLGKLTSNSANAVHVIIPIHGPSATSDLLLNLLKEHYNDDNMCKIYHFDIDSSVLSGVDTILFSLLILRGLNDSQGRVWRCHPAQLYAIEVTAPINMNVAEKEFEVQTLSFLSLLPTTECLSPMKVMKTLSPSPSQVGMDDDEFHAPMFQRVYQYLRRYRAGVNLDNPWLYQRNCEGSKSDCLTHFLRECGVPDPSWAEVHNFVKCLNLQLECCESSIFCDMRVMDCAIHSKKPLKSSLKGFVIKFMIRMSQDFAMSSLQGDVDHDKRDSIQSKGECRRRWEESFHPYIVFNEDRTTISFVGFMVSPSGDLIDPRGDILERNVLTSPFCAGFQCQHVDLNDDYRKWNKATMIQKLSLVMGIEYPYDPDDTYVLTVDNLIKILAIQMRFRCGIPVVIMGETGCGKTRLIRYMCDLARQGKEKRNMLIMKVHSGTTEEDIKNFIEMADREAKQNHVKNMDTIVFFDEANTTDAIGLIKEIMCDRRLHGKPVSEDLKFIASCNPYRKYSENTIRRLEIAGLGFYVRETETHQKLGKIFKQQLVYRVLDLPPSMRPLVYDFGQLQQVTEDDYIRQIVYNHVIAHPGLSLRESPHYISAVAKVLAWSQAYMRGCKDECNFVSLRDVERAMIVFKYFYEKMDVFAPLIDQKQREEEEDEDSYDEESDAKENLMHHGVVRPLSQAIGKITRALILSLSMCYHARLQDRDDYEEGVSKQFANPLSLPGGDERFRDEIRWCQEVLLDNMRLGENIAKNAALRENVFMMAICIELRIPLFIVGKSGSSKSLARAVIHASMRGKSSCSNLLKDFKDVDMFSYQCSQLSTPESVIEVFNTAKRFQNTQDTKSYVAVVVLDEVGLAEDSPNLPLKALHPLLEDGTEGAGAEGKNDVIVAREERVAFIGISNWALDPAKMNRGVMVTRGDPSEDELEYSAEGICSNEEDDPVKVRLKQYFKPLSEAYMEICEVQEREFFGLRDFYSLIKMLYWMCEKSGNPPTWPQLEHAIKRNFGGLESTELDPVKIFMDKLPCRREPPDLYGIPEELHSIVSPDCTRLGLIQASFSSKERTWHCDNRYLLLLTENYTALDILKHYNWVDSTPTHNTAPFMTNKAFVLFGSSFPKDKEYAQVCRNIDKVKICMEKGQMLILLNLENLYELLHNALDQFYIYYGDKRYIHLDVRTHREHCIVHDKFKLILIAEKDTVYDKFPAPLINRLEKHIVLTSSILDDWQHDIVRELELWISLFCETSGKKFAKRDVFVGYQKDTPAVVVFRASNFLRRLREEDNENVVQSNLEVLNRAGILKAMPIKVLLDREDITEWWRAAVLPLSQFLILQTASTNARVCLQTSTLAETKKEDMTKCFKMLNHIHSIEAFLADQLHNCDGKGGLLIQVTTHGNLLTHDELEKVRKTTGMRVESCILHEFETELDFIKKTGAYFKRDKEDERNVLVIIQCDLHHSNGDLIAFARRRIYDIQSEEEQGAHIVFVIHLHHEANSSFITFLGEPWISVHITSSPWT